MFKIQRLEITGFKSFADHTEIIFPGEGITAIVGPNGCGKSNLSEAISWVLGEQRAKNLRGSEMQDLIFQGTNKRPPSSMAEVCLHLTFIGSENLSEEFDRISQSKLVNAVNEVKLDEAEETFIAENGKQADSFSILQSKGESLGAGEAENRKTLSGKRKSQFSTKSRDWQRTRESISVTRRLFRSGESEYLINGKPCRLRDIQDLFAGTGLSGAKYAIIEQGYIGQILSAKPADRRALIEEAAGVLRFRVRQKAAQIRLETAKANLNRVNDIIDEVGKQVASLKRQASKVEKYKKLKEELRAEYRRIFALKAKALLKEAEEAELKHVCLQKQEAELVSRFQEIERSLQQVKQDRLRKEDKLNQLRTSYTEKLLQQSRAAKDLEHKKEQVEILKERQSQIQAEAFQASNRLVSLEEEAKNLREKEQKLKTQVQEIALEELEASYKAISAEIRSLESKLKDIEDEKSKHIFALERFNETIRQNQNLIERFLERLEGLKREGERAEASYSEYFKEHQDLQRELDEIRTKIDSLQAEKEAVSENEKKVKATVIKLENELKTLNQALLQNRHSLESLKEINSSYYPAVQKILANQEKIGIRLLGTLADKLNVKIEHEKAIESILGDFLQTILVSSEEDALKLVEYVTTENLGCSILCLQPNSKKTDRIKNETANENSKVLNLLGVDEDLAETLKEVLKREVDAELVSDIWTANGCSEISINSNGDFTIAGKLFVIGKQANSKSLLRFKRKLKLLEEESLALEKSILETSKQLESAQTLLLQETEKISNLETLKNELERSFLSKQVQLESLAREIERSQRHKKVVDEETRQILEEITQLEQRRKNQEMNLESAREALSETNSKLEHLNKELLEKRKEFEKVAAELNLRKTEMQVTEERKRQIKQVLKRVESEAAELKKRILNSESILKQNQQKLETLIQEIKDLETEVKTTGEVSAAAEANIQNLSGELEELRSEEEKLSNKLSELNKNLAEVRKNRTDIEIKKAEAAANLKNLDENCYQQLGEALSKIIEKTEESNLEEACRKADEITAKIESLGAINMLAIEDLKEAEQRLNFLLDQKADILESIRDAEEALEEIKKRSRQKFLEAFESINENFKRLFKELFGGGTGEMRLIGDNLNDASIEEFSEAGIEIIAQPPGKKLQNVLLLSGGEKAMVALALTLAIFEYRPSPFCILDEVDAPLDDANINRFVEKLKQMASKTQFIVITHNKKTMEAAQALYGVTMQERGISKIVSVKLV
jgi:chromosome segregation protein